MIREGYHMIREGHHMIREGHHMIREGYHMIKEMTIHHIYYLTDLANIVDATTIQAHALLSKANVE